MFLDTRYSNKIEPVLKLEFWVWQISEIEGSFGKGNNITIFTVYDFLPPIDEIFVVRIGHNFAQILHNFADSIWKFTH